MNTLTAQAKKSLKFLILLAILGGLFGAHPYIIARVVAGPSWQGVVPEFAGDGLYYMTRANAAIHGEMTGNLYYATPFKDPSPTLSIADNIAGIPYAFLSPFGAAMFNAFLWSAIFTLLFGGLLLWLGYSRAMIIISLVIVESSIFERMLRATVMQMINPYFLFFFILLLGAWYRDRLHQAEKNWPLLLGFCAGFTPYLYTFLFQITAASLFVGIALSLVLRRMRLARSLIISIAVMLVLSIPYLVYFKGVGDFPSFAQTMNHFGGVRSHMLSPQVYFYGRWLVLLLAWSFFLLVHARTKGSGSVEDSTAESAAPPSFEDVILTIATISLGTLGVMMSNVITGVDIAAPPHANNFVKLLLPVSLVLLALPTMRTLLVRGFYVQKLLIIFCALVVATEVFVALPASFPNLSRYQPNNLQFAQYAGNPQYLMPTLIALRSLSGAHVIVAPEPLNSYIPLYAGQHTLFSLYGGFFSTGTIENVERSLVSRLGKPLTQEGVTQAYGEAADTDSELLGRNKLARKLCALVVRSPSCETLIVARSFTNDGKVDQRRWFDFYQTAVSPHPIEYLHAFNVSEVVIDRRLPIPVFLSAKTPWYSDQYYAIYDISSFAK